jgi:E3 ubiquitin-protein ligase HECTD1
MCADKADEADHVLALNKAEKEKDEKLRFQNYISQIGGRKELYFQSNFDENGLIYLLGTLGKQINFENPAKKWMVNVFASSLSPDSEKPSEVASRRDCSVSTNLEDQPMITLEFAKVSLVLTKYSIKHSNKKGAGALRSWVLLGSKDGHSWDKISAHKKDASLKDENSMMTWNVNSKHDYSFFRIRMEGANSANEKILNIGGIELYGIVFFR